MRLDESAEACFKYYNHMTHSGGHMSGVPIVMYMAVILIETL